MTYKLFTDGNAFPRAKRSGFGGFIQNPEGEIILEFTEQVRERRYSHNFEILGIIRGMKLAAQYGVTELISYCDDKNTTQRLHEIFVENTFAVSEAQKPELFHKVIELSKQFKKVSFEYIPREYNKKADNLSRRYAKHMEDSWLRQYNHDLDTSAMNLERNVAPKRRAFFAHKNIIRLVHKNNPFLVAQQRSKMARKVIRTLDKENFHFMFIEYYKSIDGLKLRTSIFSPDKERIFSVESINPQPNNERESIDIFHNHLNDVLNEVALNHPYIKELWINSNNDNIMAYTEQCEKIHPDNWAVFYRLFKTLSKFNEVLFHHLPFQPSLKFVDTTPTYVMTSDERWEQILAEYHEITNPRQKKRKFGQLICHTLKTQKENGLTIDDDYVNKLIEQMEKTLDFSISSM